MNFKGNRGIGLPGDLEIYIAAEAVFFDAAGFTLNDGLVVPAVSYDGKQQRGAAVPEFRVSLPDVFFSGAVLIGD